MKNSVLGKFLVAFFVGSFITYSQDSTKLQISIQTQFMYHPSDFFWSIGTSIHQHKLSYNIDLGLGVRSTFFQNQLTPRISYNFGYAIRLSKLFIIQPELRASYFFQRIQILQSTLLLQEIESFLAGKIFLGNKHAAFVAGGVGPAWSFNNKSSFFHWSYFSEIGYRYVF